MVSVPVLGAAMACAVAAVTAGAAPAAADTPAANVVAPVDFAEVCWTAPAAPACQEAVLADINAARSVEGIGPMVLPANFGALDVGRQAFVVTDLERVDRGLRPIVGLSADLDALATAAATARTDPVFTGSLVGPMQGIWWTGIWAYGPNPLVADLLWMYEDGYGGADTTNIDCPSADAAGCWGHRLNILSDYAGAPEIVGGVGSAADGQSVAEVAVGGTGELPALVYTWASAVAAGADGHAPLVVSATVVAHTATVKHPRKHAKRKLRAHRRSLRSFAR